MSIYIIKYMNQNDLHFKTDRVLYKRRIQNVSTIRYARSRHRQDQPATHHQDQHHSWAPQLQNSQPQQKLFD